jgi:hypothetical protein
MRHRIPDSRFLKLSMRARTGEVATSQTRRGEGGQSPAGAGKRELGVGLAGSGRREVRGWHSLGLLLEVGSQERMMKQVDDNHQWEGVVW